MNNQMWTKDIAILIMGATGAGKSTFINYLAGRNVAKVGNALVSCTNNLQFISFGGERYPDFKGRIIIIDTPGFDDTSSKSDIEILKDIAARLGSFLKDGRSIFGGVIYLHDISSDRFNGTAQRNLRMFQDFYAEMAPRKVILGSTKRQRTDESTADAYLSELNRIHWKDLASKGAKVSSFKDSPESAWAFVDVLMQNINIAQHKPGEVCFHIPREQSNENKASKDSLLGRLLRLLLNRLKF